MKQSNRLKRVESALQQELSRIFREDIRDPRLPGLFTVRHVEVSGDMHYATVHFSQLPDDDESIKQSEEFLEDSAGYIRSLLAQRVNLKFTPEVRFHFDPSERDYQRINKKLQELKNAGELGPEETEE